jgi:tRNA A37 threonylcarbamoyladenosine synthetase subunit TsaC/SUA5/YrdC
MDAAGLRVAAHAMLAGRAVVLPTCSPLPYVVAGRDPAVVNGAKGRPADQPVALWVRGVDELAPLLQLDSDRLLLLVWLMTRELVTVLVPVARPDDCPRWLLPSVSKGYALVCDPALPTLTELRTDLHPVYVSSGNRTRRRPAVTVGEADEGFGHELIVVDGDADRDLSRPHASSTMVRLERGGGLSVARHGVQDTPSGGPPNPGYLDDLVSRCPLPSAGIAEGRARVDQRVMKA